MKIDRDYVAVVERMARLIPEWCAARERLPDLKFFDHGNVMVGAALEPITYGLLARTPDAVALLEYLEAREPGGTIFQARCALGHLGFLQGSEVLSIHQITAMMAGKCPIVQFERGKAGPKC